MLKMDAALNEVFLMLRTRFRIVGLQCLSNESFWGDKKALVIAVTVVQATVVFTAPDLFYYSSRFMRMETAAQFLGINFIGLLILAAFSCFVNIHAHEESYGEILEEMKKFHLSETPWVSPILQKHFRRAAKRTKIVFIVVTVLIIFAFLMFLVVGCFLDKLLQNSAYPLPSFYRMSFLPIDNWWTYFLNLTQQAFFALSSILNYQVIAAILFLISLFTIAKLDALVEMIKLQDEITKTVSFDEWYLEVHKQMEEIRRNLLKLRRVNQIWFYAQEKTCYFIVLTTYLMFNIDLKMVGVCFSGLTIVTGITIAVLLNELFFTKFKEANQAIYDLPWYWMSPRERRYIAILLSASQTPIVMSSAGITDLTLEWLGSIVKGGYSAGLVMKDMISIE